MKGDEKIFFSKLLGPLIQKDLLLRESFKSKNPTMTRTWDVYKLTTAAKTMLNSISTCKIMIPPTEAMLISEQAEKEKVTKRMQIHIDRGLDLSIVPQEEKDEGKGPTLQTLTTWYMKLKKYREDTTKVHLADKYIELRLRILSWRNETAQLLKMAPTTVMREILTYKIAYSLVTTEADLFEIGVRSNRINVLASLLTSSIAELELEQMKSESSERDVGAKMILPSGTFHPNPMPPFAPVLPKKPPKKEAGWKINYRKFMELNQSVVVIAVSIHKAKESVHRVYGKHCS